MTQPELALYWANELRKAMGGAPLTVNPIKKATGSVHTTGTAKAVSAVYYGTATWYGGKFQNRRTASGEIFNQYNYTAAHRSLPFGTRLLVTNLKTGKKVTVRVNDRGPFVRGMVLDLSRQAAADIGLLRSGTGKVKYVIVR